MRRLMIAGTAVLLLPYRPPLLTAKWIASLQALSEGRILLGVGAGWMAEEFQALGVDRGRRGALTDEGLDFLQRCFDEDVIESHGQTMVFAPRPERPPFLIGGTAAVAIPRAAARGDGWLPVGVDPSELKEIKGDDSGAEDVSGIVEGRGDAGNDGNRPVVPHFFNLLLLENSK